MMAALDLRAFLDESGTDTNSTSVVVAGYLAPADDWNLLEAQWLDALKTRNAPYYHATDAEGKTPHGPYEGWSTEQAHELTDFMASIVGSLDNLKAVGAFIETADWLDAAKLIESFLHTNPELRLLRKQLFNIPFQILAKACLDIIVENLNPSLRVDETVAFIFEDNDFKHATLSARDELKQTHPLRARIGSIDFEPKTQYAGLQAADLIAWSYRRVTDLRRQGGTPDQIHRNFASLIRSGGSQFRHCTREQLFERIYYHRARFLSGEAP
jgi:hypothetical protein